VSDSTRTSAIRIKDLSKRYGQRWALIRLNLEIPTGRAVLLTGENGAGKTTLLRIIATALRPTHGRLEIFGDEAFQSLESIRTRIGLITHQSYLYDDLSAHENLVLAQRLTGRPDATERQNVLASLSLSAHADRPVRTFSAGMKRRLCVARMLLRQPDLVLLDEPFGQLDPGGVGLMENVIRTLREQKRTLVVATHDIERGRALCDWHLDLHAGRIARSLEPIQP
jgi:heme exporter protein A